MAHKDRARENAVQRIKYHERRAEHRCAYCGQYDERTLSGCSACARCQARRREIRAADTPQAERIRERERESFKRRRQARIEAGMCALCGKRPPRPGRRLCESCAAYMNAKQKESYRRGREKAARKVSACPYMHGGELSCLTCTRDACEMDREDV